MDKYIVIIRSNGLQKLDVYKKIREKGYKIAVFEKGFKNENNMADIVVEVDLTSTEKLLTEIISFSEEHEVASIVSFTEFNLEQSALVNQILSKRGHSLKSIKIARNKYLTRLFTSKNNIISPKFTRIRSLSEAKERIKQFDLPVIIKPTNLANSYSVVKIENENELDGKFAKLERLKGKTPFDKYLTDTSEDAWIMEDYLEGFEISVESITYEGETRVVAVHDKMHDVEAPYFFESLFLTPSERITPDLLKTVEQMTKEILKAIDFTFGVSHVEYRVTKKGPVLVEVNPRQCGSLLVDSVYHSTKVNIPETLIDMSLGIKPQINIERRDFCAMQILYAPCEGRIEEIEGFDEAMEVKNILLAERRLKPGDVVLDRQVNDIGVLLACGTNKDEVLKNLSMAVSKIKVKVKHE
ncbi:MAG: ATP-grasp domain-containing protein [Clostridia bacterium]|nr:ATP-grasp domain-containing protein [Clostridia bacterium]